MFSILKVREAVPPLMVRVSLLPIMPVIVLIEPDHIVGSDHARDGNRDIGLHPLISREGRFSVRRLRVR